jgi:hypothetical protein
MKRYYDPVRFARFIRLRAAMDSHYTPPLKFLALTLAQRLQKLPY